MFSISFNLFLDDFKFSPIIVEELKKDKVIDYDDLTPRHRKLEHPSLKGAMSQGCCCLRSILS